MWLKLKSNINVNTKHYLNVTQTDMSRYLCRFEVTVTEIEVILAGGLMLNAVQQKVGTIIEYPLQFKFKILVRCFSSPKMDSFSWRLPYFRWTPLVGESWHIAMRSSWP